MTPTSQQTAEATSEHDGDSSSPADPADVTPSAAAGTSSSDQAPERSALIRKTPFVAYTAAAIVTIYILAQPDSLGDLLVPTVVAGLVLTIGYMTWSELRG